MASVWFSYVLLGLSLSAPVGPISIAQIKAGLKNGFWNAWFLGLGAMSTDVIFMLLIYYGATSFLTTPLAKLILWIAGFILLLYLGYESIREARSTVQITDSDAKKEHVGSSFLSGFLLALSNPLNIVFWIGIYGSVMASTMDVIGKQDTLLYSSAIIVGILIWDLFVAIVTHVSRKAVTPRLMQYVSIAAGIVFIGCGIYFGYSAVQQAISFF